MDKSLLNIELLTSRITVIRNSIIEMHKLSRLSEEEFLSDIRNPASAETFLRHALEAIFDTGRHILAKVGGFKLELEYKAIARGLGERGIITRELAETLVPIAGYRNRIVHFYHEITPSELYGILQDDLRDLEKFIRQITRFLEINGVR